MLMVSRQQELLEILKKERSATVRSLAKRLFASEPTIRRDLIALEEQGYLKRVHGGAVIGGAPDREIPYEVRADEQKSAKAQMAAKAAEYLYKGAVVFLDGSSSASYMVEHLKQFEDVLVITSGAKTAIKLAECGIRVISTGGQMITRSYSLVGTHAEECVRSMHADVAFFSCRGLSDEGEMTDIAIEEINMRKLMIERSRVKVLLCDSSKMGKQYVYSLGYIDNIDAVISEK